MSNEEVVYDGKFLRAKKTESGWEYIERPNCTGAVVVANITDNYEVVFVEQFRPPVKSQCIELPAGLVGDEGGVSSVVESAKKELLEETGFEAESISEYPTMFSSPGLTNEKISYCVATGLKKVGAGGGVGSENIKVHVVPYDDIFEWLTEQERKGKVISSNVASGLFFLLHNFSLTNVE